MKRVHLLPLLALATLCGAASAPAAPEIPATPVGQAFDWFLATMNSEASFETEQRFAPSFLAQVPADKLDTIMRGSRQQFGGLELLEVTPKDDFDLTARVRATALGIDLNVFVNLEPEPPHRFTGLLMQPAPPRVTAGDDWSKLATDLAALGSTTALAIDRTDDAGHWVPAHRLGSSAPLALGSSFKLWVLLALAQAVDNGTVAYADVLPIVDSSKSLPSGEMRNSPVGTPHTLAHYAARMIATSDNTATDHLIHHLGRDAIIDTMTRFCAQAERNVPFLTTRELFVLKLGDIAWRQRYLAASASERRQLLDGELAGAPIDLETAAAWKDPVAIDTLEWFATADEMNRTMRAAEEHAARPGHLPLANALRINAGLPLDREAWTVVSFKGGSEPGVLSLVYGLERHDGVRFSFALIVNDPTTAPDQNAVFAVATRALGLLTKD